MLKIFKNFTYFFIILNCNVIFADIDNNLIKKLNISLAKLDQVAIEFVQIDQNNKIAQGKILISKPHHFRCNYYPPYPLLIVGGSKYISIYDYELDTITRVDTQDSITNILLLSNLEEKKEFKVIETREGNKHFILKMLHVDKNQFSELFFDKESLVLAKIKIFEMQKPTIVLEMSNPVKIKKFTKDLFLIPSPEIFGRPKFLDKQELEKLYESY